MWYWRLINQNGLRLLRLNLPESFRRQNSTPFKNRLGLFETDKSSLADTIHIRAEYWIWMSLIMTGLAYLKDWVLRIIILRLVPQRDSRHLEIMVIYISSSYKNPKEFHPFKSDFSERLCFSTFILRPLTVIWPGMPILVWILFFGFLISHTPTYLQRSHAYLLF